jgi:Ricin-type beta-trefoil lectin domain-like
VAGLKLELHLPGLVIGVDDIKLTGLSRKFGRSKPVGPYLITGRASGLALDATQQYDQGPRVAACSPHALPHQLWYLRPGGVKDEVTIISATSRLALDSTRETSGDIHPVMWEPNGEPWQRWRLEPTPDGIGFLIKSPHNGNFLTLSEEARWHLDEPWAPWFTPREGNHNQQWIFSLPMGNI